MRKKIALLMSITMLAGLLSACGSSGSKEPSTPENTPVSEEAPVSEGAEKEESAAALEDGLGRKGAMDNFTAETNFKATEPMTFSILYRDHPSYPVNNDWRFWNDLTELTNVSFERTDVANAEHQQMFNLIMSSGEAPEILPRINRVWGQPFIASGSLLRISDYLDYMPHFKARADEWGLWDEINALRDVDGNLYFLPGMYEKIWHNHGLLIRTDIIEELGLEMPDTWDDMYEVMKAMKAAYPDCWPMSDSNKMDGTLNHASVAFGVTAGWGLSNGVVYDFDKEAYKFAPVTDEMREFLTFFHKLYEEGMIDPESLTQDNDMATQKFVNGQSFMMTGNAVLRDQFRASMDEVLGEDQYSIGRVLLPGGPAGNVIRGLRVNDSGIMFPAKIAEQDNFIAILQFVDWLYYSEEGNEFTRWGIEGDTFKWDETTGRRTFLAPYTFMGIGEGEQDIRLEAGYGNGIFDVGQSAEQNFSYMDEEEVAYQEAMNETRTVLAPDPASPLTDSETEQISLINNSIKDAVSTAIMEFISGRRPLEDSEWEKFKAEMSALNYETVLDIMNGAHERYLESNGSGN